jgi:hypothetical protein
MADETRQPWTYTRKTPAELEQLAWDIIGGRVFGTWSHPDAASLSFMILHLLDREQIEALKANEIVHMYEYLDKAGPRSVNGLPSFMSCLYLDKHDAGELMRRCQELDALKSERATEAAQLGKE